MTYTEKTVNPQHYGSDPVDIVQKVQKNFCLHPSLHLLVIWAWWDWPLTWLTNHHPSVLWHCWLGHVTHKIVSEMTYNVSSGTLNSTIPYHTIPSLITSHHVFFGQCFCLILSTSCRCTMFAPVSFTCPNHPNVRFFIIKPTGSQPQQFSKFCIFLTIFQSKPACPSDCAHFSSI